MLILIIANKIELQCGYMIKEKLAIYTIHAVRL